MHSHSDGGSEWAEVGSEQRRGVGRGEEWVKGGGCGLTDAALLHFTSLSNNMETSRALQEDGQGRTSGRDQREGGRGGVGGGGGGGEEEGEGEEDESVQWVFRRRTCLASVWT